MLSSHVFVHTRPLFTFFFFFNQSKVEAAENKTHCGLQIKVLNIDFDSSRPAINCTALHWSGWPL